VTDQNGKPKNERRRLRLAPGPLAQVIFATLDAAKASTVTHARGGNAVVVAAPWTKEAQRLATAGWEAVGDGRWQLPVGVYDMRTSARYLAKEHGYIDPDGRIRSAFQQAFSNAMRLLCDARILVADDPDLPNTHERRFVRKASTNQTE
jgi:hypothetical protein